MARRTVVRASPYACEPRLGRDRPVRLPVAAFDPHFEDRGKLSVRRDGTFVISLAIRAEVHSYLLSPSRRHRQQQREPSI